MKKQQGSIIVLRNNQGRVVHVANQKSPQRIHPRTGMSLSTDQKRSITESDKESRIAVIVTQILLWCSVLAVLIVIYQEIANLL